MAGRSVALPSVETLQEYRALYHSEHVWTPVVEEICRRHSLPCNACRRGPDGTHIVYFVGGEVVVKLFVPLFGTDFFSERVVAYALGGTPDVATPAVMGEGEIGGWRYLILTRVPGVPLRDVWAGMPNEDRTRVIRQIGEFIRSLRSLSLKGLTALAFDWDAFVRARVAALELKLSEAHPEVARGLSSYIASSPLCRSAGLRSVLLLSDITREHVMVAHTADSWRFVGYVDFGDAMIGPEDYEIVAPGVDIVRGDRELLRELLMGAGHGRHDLDQGLQHRLMTCTLIHRYLTLADVMSSIPNACAATSVDEIARIVWPL